MMERSSTLLQINEGKKTVLLDEHQLPSETSVVIMPGEVNTIDQLLLFSRSPQIVWPRNALRPHRTVGNRMRTHPPYQHTRRGTESICRSWKPGRRTNATGPTNFHLCWICSKTIVSRSFNTSCSIHPGELLFPGRPDTGARRTSPRTQYYVRVDLMRTYGQA